MVAAKYDEISPPSQLSYKLTSLQPISQWHKGSCIHCMQQRKETRHQINIINASSLV